MIIDCYWGMSNPGILAIGLENGLRKLKGVEINNISVDSSQEV